MVYLFICIEHMILILLVSWYKDESQRSGLIVFAFQMNVKDNIQGYKMSFRGKRCDMAFIEPMHRNKPNTTYLLSGANYIRLQWW